MSINRFLPERSLNYDKVEFLKAWDVNPEGELLGSEDGLPDVHIWSGRFVCGETVVLGAATTTQVQPNRGDLFVGIVREADYEEASGAGLDPLEVFVDATVSPTTHGLNQVIELLRAIKGLPEEKE